MSDKHRHGIDRAHKALLERFTGPGVYDGHLQQFVTHDHKPWSGLMCMTVLLRFVLCQKERSMTDLCKGSNSHEETIGCYTACRHHAGAQQDSNHFEPNPDFLEVFHVRHRTSSKLDPWHMTRWSWWWVISTQHKKLPSIKWLFEAQNHEDLRFALQISHSLMSQWLFPEQRIQRKLRPSLFPHSARKERCQDGDQHSSQPPQGTAISIPWPITFPLDLLDSIRLRFHSITLYITWYHFCLSWNLRKKNTWASFLATFQIHLPHPLSPKTAGSATPLVPSSQGTVSPPLVDQELTEKFMAIWCNLQWSYGIVSGNILILTSSLLILFSFEPYYFVYFAYWLFLIGAESVEPLQVVRWRSIDPCLNIWIFWLF